MLGREGGDSLLVDDHAHVGSAVLALGAVDPDGAGAVDGDGVGGEDAHGGAGGDGLEARVEADDAAVVQVDGLAGVGKVGLRHRVVARRELELDVVAHVGLDAVGREGQGAVHADRDDGGLLGCGVGRAWLVDQSRVNGTIQYPIPI